MVLRVPYQISLEVWRFLSCYLVPLQDVRDFVELLQANLLEHFPLSLPNLSLCIRLPVSSQGFSQRHEIILE